MFLPSTKQSFKSIKSYLIATDHLLEKNIQPVMQNEPKRWVVDLLKKITVVTGFSYKS